jgi:hypothetical protein
MGEGLVLRVHLKPTSLWHVAEMMNVWVDHEQLSVKRRIFLLVRFQVPGEKPNGRHVV